MNTGQNASRRNFIKTSSMGLGFGLAHISTPFVKSDLGTGVVKPPLYIKAVGIDLKGIQTEATTSSRVKEILARAESLAGMRPDIICLPELFGIPGKTERPSLEKLAEEETRPGPVTLQAAALARQLRCYIACPLITRNEGRFYNSVLLLDRQGQICGSYHKTYPNPSEILPDQDFIGGGITPGAFDQPLIATDFGKVGIQIGEDVNWSRGWNALREKKADLAVFSSSFSAGRMLNYYALKNNYYILSGSGDDARIIDISGNDLDVTSDFVRCAWAAINLNKVNVSTWPTNGLLPGLFKKYGDKLRIKVWGNTDVITLESLDPKLKVAHVLKEFEIPSYADLLQYETAIQEKYRQESAWK